MQRQLAHAHYAIFTEARWLVALCCSHRRYSFRGERLHDTGREVQIPAVFALEKFGNVEGGKSITECPTGKQPFDEATMDAKRKETFGLIVKLPPPSNASSARTDIHKVDHAKASSVNLSEAGHVRGGARTAARLTAQKGLDATSSAIFHATLARAVVLGARTPCRVEGLECLSYSTIVAELHLKKNGIHRKLKFRSQLSALRPRQPHSRRQCNQHILT